jgi:hypothetical protein
MTAIGPMTSAWTRTGVEPATSASRSYATVGQPSAISDPSTMASNSCRSKRYEPCSQGSGVGTGNRATAAIKQRLLRAGVSSTVAALRSGLVRDRCSPGPEPSGSARPIGRLLLVLQPHDHLHQTPESQGYVYLPQIAPLPRKKLKISRLPRRNDGREADRHTLTS